MISKLLNSHMGRILLSIVWGFGLSCIFRKVCKGRNCIIYKAPNNNTIKNNIYLFDDKCYKFTKKATRCDNSKKIVDFA